MEASHRRVIYTYHAEKLSSELKRPDETQHDLG